MTEYLGQSQNYKKITKTKTKTKTKTFFILMQKLLAQDAIASCANFISSFLHS